MKKFISILFLFLSVSVFAQSKLDSLVLVKVNEYRTSLGLNKVEFNKICYKAAECQATYLAKKQIVGHDQDTKGFETLDKRLKFFGKTNFLKAGEICNFVPINLDVKDTLGYDKLANKILESWRTSPSHNKALIDPDFKYVANFSKEIVTKSGFVNKNHYEVFSTMVFIDK
jgi:uncharacterized protein YkwD